MKIIRASDFEGNEISETLEFHPSDSHSKLIEVRVEYYRDPCGIYRKPQINFVVKENRHPLTNSRFETVFESGDLEEAVEHYNNI